MKPQRTILFVLMLMFLASPVIAQVSLRATGLMPDDPLTVTATASPTELVVEVDVTRGWYLYGRDTGGGQPVTIEINEGSAFEAAGALQVVMDDSGKITGKSRITLPLKQTSPLKKTGKGGKLSAKFRFMACDPLMCLPPREVLLSGSVLGSKKDRKSKKARKSGGLNILLAVTEVGERSARIERFLKEQGFRCTVLPYSNVSQKICDQHHVVLADSPLFDKAKAFLQKAQAFPKTRTPIIGVGYLGAELLEAHKIAMSSGYI